MVDVRLANVTKRYDGVSALDDFSLSVASGEFMVVVGPSGSGKTTMLRCIAGLDEPDSGDIFIGGRWANDIPIGKRDVQMIFQTLALWPHMRVLNEQKWSNVSFPLRVRGWAVEQVRERVGSVARRVGLNRWMYDRRPDELSGGERQRVALARALTAMPSVYLMDEPMSNMDPIARVRMREEIKTIHRDIGATTLYVTHNMADARAMADRVAMMDEGRIVQVGTIDELEHQPLSPWVTAFLRTA